MVETTIFGGELCNALQSATISLVFVSEVEELLIAKKFLMLALAHSPAFISNFL